MDSLLIVFKYLISSVLPPHTSLIVGSYIVKITERNTHGKGPVQLYSK